MSTLLEKFRAEEPGRYPSEEELSGILASDPTLVDRVKALRAARENEKAIVATAADATLRKFNFDSMGPEAQSKCVRDMAIVYRYCAVAMLCDARATLETQWLSALRTTLQVQKFPQGRESIAFAYQRLRAEAAKRLSQADMLLLDPFLESAATVLASPGGITPAGGGPHRFRHNYYDPEDFFQVNAETGEIRRHDGERCVAISEDFIAALLAGTAHDVGEEAARAILYQTGCRWALQDMRNFQPKMEKEFGGAPLSAMHLNFVLETWWWPLTTMGWGGWKYNFDLRGSGIITVDLTDSVIAQSLERLGRPLCYWYAGLFGGLFTHLSKKELQCIEIQCYATGHDRCRFMVGSDKRINAASFWVEEGATADDVLAKLA